MKLTKAAGGLVAVAGLAMISTGSTFAATKTYSDTITLQLTDFSDTLTLQKFNTGYGTLTGVKFTLSGTTQTTSTLTNKGNKAATFTTTSGATETLYRPDNTELVVTIPTTVNNVTLAKKGAAGATTNFGGTQTATATEDSGILTDSADLALFSSNGNASIVLPFDASAFSSYSGTGNAQYSIDTSASAIATVTYYYLATPEPTTTAALALGVLGVFGMMIVARKRATSAF